ncbi:hypothetical protein BGZ57DRAFT_864491, partial [Hyaloscypha finlandica]
MHPSKLFSVSIYLYIDIANASILAARKTCSGVTTSYVSCKESDGNCDAIPSCHNHFFWRTCYCPSGQTMQCHGC